MKKLLFIFSIVLLGLSGCTTFDAHISKQEPLHKTLNEVKKELRAFKYAISLDQNNDGTPDMKFTCGGKNYPLAEHMVISQIKVTVALEKTREAEGQAGLSIGSAVSLGGSRSKSKSNSNALVLNLVPTEIPANDSDATASEGGIARSLIAVVDQLVKVNSKAPCLKSGTKSTLTLGFSVKSSRANEGGIDLVVFSVEGGKSKTSSYSNEIEVTFNFGDAATLRVQPTS